jgi:hypothetical protein
MIRVFAAAVLFVSAAWAADPPDAVTRAVAVQKAVHDAKEALASGQPAVAAAALEAQLPNADGGKEFLALLGRAYVAELNQLRTAAKPDEKRIREVTTRMAALGLTPEPAPVIPAAVAATPATDPLAAAAGFFKKADFSAAGKLFEKAFNGKIELRPDQIVAWAYCRVKVAADQLNQPGADAAVAKAVEKEVTEALALAPTHEGLQKAGADVLAAARKRLGVSTPAPSTTPLPAGWEAVETASFRVRHQGNKALADAVAKAAEAKRTEIYSRWSGPPRGAWQTKCEVVLYSGEGAFVAATKQPAGATGLATVKIEDGAVAERRIDLRADDPGVAADALPRELTHVVLADLFPTQAPPMWAEVGMAVLASSDDEVGRYTRAATTVGRTGELFGVADLVALVGFPPADKVTGFYTAAVTLVEYLVKVRGEKAFTTFLRDSQRYGIEAALRRNYDTDAKKLDTAWRQAVLAGR